MYLSIERSHLVRNPVNAVSMAVGASHQEIQDTSRANLHYAR